MKKLLPFLFLLLFAGPVLALDHPQSCGNMGGRLDLCAKRLKAFPRHAAIPPGQYGSGGTWILTKAGCVHPNTLFRFHGAYNAQDRVDWQANVAQKQLFAGLPNLLGYLNSVGAFESTRLTDLTGPQIAMIEPRMRLCR